MWKGKIDFSLKSTRGQIQENGKVSWWRITEISLSHYICVPVHADIFFLRKPFLTSLFMLLDTYILILYTSAQHLTKRAFIINKLKLNQIKQNMVFINEPKNKTVHEYWIKPWRVTTLISFWIQRITWVLSLKSDIKVCISIIILNINFIACQLHLHEIDLCRQGS